MKSEVFCTFLALLVSCGATYLNSLTAKYAVGNPNYGTTGYPVTIIAKAPIAYTLSPYGLNTAPVDKPAYNYPVDYPMEAYTIIYEGASPYGLLDAANGIPVSGALKQPAPVNPSAKYIYVLKK